MGLASIAQTLKSYLEENLIVLDQEDDEVKRVYRKRRTWYYESEADYDIEIQSTDNFYLYENGQKEKIDFS